MRTRITLALKVAVTLALLAFALVRADLRGVGDALADLGPAAVALLAVLTAAQIALSAFRWHRVLAYLGESIPTLSLASDTLVGTTYNMLLPTTVGGDVVRALRCARRAGAPQHAWASVVYERIMGLACLALLPASALALGAARAKPIYLVVAGSALVLFAAFLAYAHAPLRLVARLAERRAPTIAGFSSHLADSFAGPLARPAARLETFAWSLAYQIVALSMIVVASGRATDSAAWLAAYVGTPIVLILAMLPITIAGLGLRESLFVAILPEFGLPVARAGMLAFVWLAANLACAIAGGVVAMTGEPLGREGSHAA